MSKLFHISPHEIDLMPYWEYEYFIKECQNVLDAEAKENERQEKEQKKYSKIPKLPKIPSYKK